MSFQINKRLSVIAIGILFKSIILAQSLQHPVIMTTDAEKAQVLEKIEKYDWAASIVEQLHNMVDEHVKKHQSDPGFILKQIPKFAAHDRVNKERQAGPVATGHNIILSLASNAAVLYYLTDEEKYAAFAADILAFYIDDIAPRTPETTSICGYYFFDPRTTYDVFAITYDFIHNYLQKPGVSVFNLSSGTRIKYDDAKAQKAIANMVGNVLQEYGKPDTHGTFISNHPILTAPGALFGILCIEDDKERERLFNVFWEKGTAHQNSFEHTILPMFGEQGIWPESTSYSFMPIITMVLNIVDRIYPEKDVTSNHINILKGNFLFDNLRMPDQRFVRYGDSKRNNDQTENLYRYTLNIANRRGHQDLKQQALVALKQAYEIKGGYKPQMDDGIFNNYQLLELFWGINIPEVIEGEIDFQKPTAIVKHAGVALQRNYVEKNNEQYGLCGIIGGASYVHSHATGIAMELYGAGYVMAPNAGLPPTVSERKIPLHEHYFRLYAGNNTVVVNGTSHGRDEGSWKGKANVWQNTTVNIAAEPKHLENPVSENFSFATQWLDDKVNNCDQQRTLSTIRTSETTGYYFDMFRSKSLGENKFHDYIYHNLGDETQLTDVNNKALSLRPTKRYKNDIGDVVHSPGWRYFEDTKATDLTNGAVKVRFDIEYDNRYMHAFMPQGTLREYTLALAPPTREARNGYINKKTQVLVVRQQGEAWDKPYMCVFEPSTQIQSSVQRIEELRDGDKVVGAIVVSKVNDKTISDYIICQDDEKGSYTNTELKLKFQGRYGIVRTETQGKKVQVSLYIGDGSKISFGKYSLTADDTKKGFKIINYSNDNTY